MLEMALKDETFQYEIRREFVLCDLLRTVEKKTYDPQKRVNVWFVGEEGRDTSGLSREMWRLFGSEMQRMCEGKEGCLLIKHDTTKLQVFYLNLMLLPLHDKYVHTGGSVFEDRDADGSIVGSGWIWFSFFCPFYLSVHLLGGCVFCGC